MASPIDQDKIGVAMPETQAKQRLKRNCNGCRALELRGAFKPAWCSLHHPIKPGRTIENLTVEWKPQEPCEKPTTYEEYIQLRNNLTA